MKRPLRIVQFCTFACIAWASCRASTPLPLPDASRASGLTLTVAPRSLVIRPGGNGRLKFTLRDEQGEPMRDYLLSFHLVPNNGSGIPVEAWLSLRESLTDADGTVGVQVLVGELPGDAERVSFAVQARAEGAKDAQGDVLVTANAYSVRIMPVLAEELTGVAVARTALLFFDDTSCSELDLTSRQSAPVPPRNIEVGLNQTAEFAGVARDSSSAVMGLGMDAYGTALVGGCLDLSGTSLLENVTIQATLSLNHSFPSPTGKFQAASEFVLGETPPGLARVQSEWQEWSRCSPEPARLWLDCTLDALATSASDPLDCVPASSEGQLGDILAARRGSISNMSPPTGTPCRLLVDKSGARSLEAIVSDLFKEREGELAALGLGNLPLEIAGILGKLRFDSTLDIAQDSDPNRYLVTHTLVSFNLPNAPSTPTGNFSSVTAIDLALPAPVATAIPAKLEGKQLSIGDHKLSLRLGTVTRAVFETSSLKNRGVDDVHSFVRGVFNMAIKRDASRTMTSCEALDAALCSDLGQNRGCLVSACENGVAALARKLAEAFKLLDGTGLDLTLSGSAMVIDVDGDAHADALGLNGQVGSITTLPGLWIATFDSRTSGSDVTYVGSWSASRARSQP